MSSSSSSSSSSAPFFCPRCGDGLRFSSVPELRSHLVGRHSYETLLLLSQARVRSSRPGTLLPLDGPPGTQTQTQTQTPCLALEPRSAPPPLDCLNLELDLASTSVHLLRNLAGPAVGRRVLPGPLDQVPRGALLVRVDPGLEERLGLGLDRRITRTLAEVEDRLSRRVGRLGAELQRREEELQRKEAELEEERRDWERLRDQKQEVEERADFLSRQVSAATKMMELMKNQLSEKEEELRRREEEMENIDRFLRVTAEKESEAKSRLQVFIETLLERAEHAERLLLLRGGRSLDDDIMADKPEGTFRNRRSYSVSGNYRPGEQRNSGPAGWTRTTSLEWREDASWGRTWSRRNLRHHSMEEDEEEEEEEQEEEEEEEEEEEDLWSSAEMRRLIFARTHTPGSGASSSLWSCRRHGDQGAETLRLRAGLFCVFPYLDVRSRLLAAQVCSDWRVVARHPAVWTRLRLEDRRVSTELLGSLSQWCSQTQSIVLHNLKPPSRRVAQTPEDHLENRGSVEAGLQRLLQAAGGSLLSVSVSGCSHVLTHRLLWLISCCCRNLQSLRYRSSTDPPGPEVLWALGAGCRNLTSLQVAPAPPSRRPTRFGNRCLQTIGRCWPRLHTLSVGGAGCGTQGLVAVARGCAELRELELVCVPGLGQQVAAELCSAGLRKLHVLILTRCGVTSDTVLLFYRLVQDLRSLVVHVAASDYCEDAGQSFGDILDTLKVLQTRPGLCDVLQVQAEVL